MRSRNRTAFPAHSGGYAGAIKWAGIDTQGRAPLAVGLWRVLPSRDAEKWMRSYFRLLGPKVGRRAAARHLASTLKNALAY